MATVLPQFPLAVHRYVRAAFLLANRRVCERIARVPNSPEESLDHTLIDSLAGYAAPRVVAPGWLVRIDVHFIGAMRHWEHWEVADIGLVVIARNARRVTSQKIALLQSKRLYPNKGGVNQETVEDYYLGIGRLLRAGAGKSMALAHVFDFTPASRYKALIVDDDQYRVMAEFENGRMPIHYLLYNPWSISAKYTYPASGRVTLGRGAGNAGCRAMPAAAVRAALVGKAKGYTPSFRDIDTAMRLSAGGPGWRLEDFVSGLLLKCKAGTLYDSTSDAPVFDLFNRRSGPIAAAIAVTIEHAGD